MRGTIDFYISATRRRVQMGGRPTTESWLLQHCQALLMIPYHAAACYQVVAPFIWGMYTHVPNKATVVVLLVVVTNMMTFIAFAECML
jgi:hypothetical protein